MDQSDDPRELERKIEQAVGLLRVSLIKRPWIG